MSYTQLRWLLPHSTLRMPEYKPLHSFQDMDAEVSAACSLPLRDMGKLSSKTLGEMLQGASEGHARLLTWATL